jgi:hypothetical protein
VSRQVSIVHESLSSQRALSNTFTHPKIRTQVSKVHSFPSSQAVLFGVKTQCPFEQVSTVHWTASSQTRGMYWQPRSTSQMSTVHSLLSSQTESLGVLAHLPREVEQTYSCKHCVIAIWRFVWGSKKFARFCRASRSPYILSFERIHLLCS